MHRDRDRAGRRRAISELAVLVVAPAVDLPVVTLGADMRVARTDVREPHAVRIGIRHGRAHQHAELELGLPVQLELPRLRLAHLARVQDPILAEIEILVRVEFSALAPREFCRARVVHHLDPVARLVHEEDSNPVLPVRRPHRLERQVLHRHVRAPRVRIRIHDRRGIRQTHELVLAPHDQVQLRSARRPPGRFHARAALHAPGRDVHPACQLLRHLLGRRNRLIAGRCGRLVRTPRYPDQGDAESPAPRHVRRHRRSPFF